MPRLAVLLILLLAGCGGSSSPDQPKPLPPKVLIVSIDGLRPDALVPAKAVNIMSLSERGAYTWSARTVLPSTTLPSHVSMLTGFNPAAHTITWDDYLPATGAIAVPTLFVRCREKGLRTVLLAGKEKFHTLRDAGGIDSYVLISGGDDAIADQVMVQIAMGFDLMFVHLPDVDLTGHQKQWMSQAYLDKVAQADRAVGRILVALPGQTSVILTADHGGHGGTHGTSDPLDMTIPWILAEPRARIGLPIRTAVSTLDTAATAAYLLGVTLGPGAQGKVVQEAILSPN